MGKLGSIYSNFDARLIPLVIVTRTCMLICGAARPSWSRTHTARTYIYAYTHTCTHTQTHTNTHAHSQERAVQALLGWEEQKLLECSRSKPTKLDQTHQVLHTPAGARDDLEEHGIRGG